MINASYGDQNCKIIPDNMIKKIKKNTNLSAHRLGDPQLSSRLSCVTGVLKY